VDRRSGDVRCPFLSIAGAAEPPVLMRQALDWHQRLDVRRKDLIVYDQDSVPTLTARSTTRRA
jgi:hypothetical protein